MYRSVSVSIFLLFYLCIYVYLLSGLPTSKLPALCMVIIIEFTQLGLGVDWLIKKVH